MHLSRSFALGLLLSHFWACQGPAPGHGQRPFDWQGHRGARGLWPENSVEGFLQAMQFPIQTLEMDVVITADSQVLLSHEPWLSPEICEVPEADGPIAETTYAIFRMSTAEVQRIPCGQRPHPRFPQQRQHPAPKPLLAEVVAAVEARTAATGRQPLRYNIETKSRPEWDSLLTPAPERFVALLLAELGRLGLPAERVSLQSFDVRTLQAAREQGFAGDLVLLVENTAGIAANLEALGFVPAVYSPYFELLGPESIDSLHAQGMAVVPWTVNEVADMRRLVDWGVDGIITDYPDRIWPIGH